jgi:hypothetical protein
VPKVRTPPPSGLKRALPLFLGRGWPGTVGESSCCLPAADAFGKNRITEVTNRVPRFDVSSVSGSGRRSRNPNRWFQRASLSLLVKSQKGQAQRAGEEALRAKLPVTVCAGHDILAVGAGAIQGRGNAPRMASLRSGESSGRREESRSASEAAKQPGLNRGGPPKSPEHSGGRAGR